MMPASTASGVVCYLTLRTERFSPRPPQTSISHQTSRHKSAHADVLASVAELNKTPIRDILGRRTCDAQEHEKPEELCSVDVLDEERQRSRDCYGLSSSARVRHQTPTCHAQVGVVALVGRAITVDDPSEQTAVACPSCFVGHGVPWQSLSEGWQQRPRCERLVRPKRARHSCLLKKKKAPHVARLAVLHFRASEVPVNQTAFFAATERTQR